jgi:hypothetical protein
MSEVVMIISIKLLTGSFGSFKNTRTFCNAARRLVHSNWVLKAAIISLVTASSLPASIISVFGTFITDDEQAKIYYTVQNEANVTVSTTSFATGGFLPILSVFDDTGNFVDLNSGGASNSDASLTWTSHAGVQYLVVLTEYDNFPNLIPTNTYSDGFTRDGQGNFTELLYGFPGPFRLDSDQLTGDWTVEFTSTDPSLLVTPEPGTAALLLGGALLLARRLKKRSAEPTN